MVKKSTWMSIKLDCILGLCRPMCGRSVTFRKMLRFFGATPQLQGAAPKGINAPFRWGTATTAPQAAEPQKSITFGLSLLAVLSLTLLTACQAASSGQPEPVTAGTLTKEYQESTTYARRKYDGREITVKGPAMTTAMMPAIGGDQGVIFLEEKEANPPRRVSCWFSKDQADQFSKVKGGQFVTVKGVFNGEAGVELRFCKLVKVG